MAKQETVIVTVTCDKCGKEHDQIKTVKLGVGRSLYELDLCPADKDRFEDQVGKWSSLGRKAVRTTTSTNGRARTNLSDWDYLETKGFTRHRGRKTAEEEAALAARR